MRITLINSVFDEGASVGRSRSLRHVLNIIPPLGLAYLAAGLERDGFDVSIIDGQIESAPGAILKKVLCLKPDIIGITASTASFESAKALSYSIKQILPQIKIILGGAHISAMPQAAIDSGLFDIGVIGEGEETLVELARYLRGDGPATLSQINGLIFKENQQHILTTKRSSIENLDKLAYPARHLLPPLSAYRPTPASYRKLPIGIIITSRGCPQACTFCDRAVFGSVYRARSVENVLGEVDEVIHKYGAKEIRFFDDCFTLDNERALGICVGLRKYKVPWTCLTTVGSVTPGLLKVMKLSGCWQVLFGLESGDDRMLAILKKGATLEKNIQAVRWAKDAGLSVRADFIVGTPNETRQTLEKTLSFALRMGLDYAHFNKFVPYPGTELYKGLAQAGRSFDFSRASSITSHTDFLYVPPKVDEDFYAGFINYAHKRFYLRLAYIMKRLFSLKSWDETVGQVKGFLSIFFLR